MSDVPGHPLAPNHDHARWEACYVELAALAQRSAQQHHCPSIAWGVVKDGALDHFGGVGGIGAVGGAEPAGVPTSETIYRIASMSKSFTAAALLRSRDQGALRLDDRVVDHEPGFAALRHPMADAADITIRDLLTMSSGMATDDAWADRHLDATDEDLDGWIAGGVRFASPTRTTFEYSNLGYAVLGRVIHRATGRRVQDIVADDLMAPIGMTRSGFHRPVDGWARPYRWMNDAWHVEGEPLGDGVIAPMGGVWSTVADMARWVSWLDDAYPSRDDADPGPLARASRREMQQAHRFGYIDRSEASGEGVDGVPARDCAFSYGYGLNVLEDEATGRQITHTGGLPGYGSSMRWLSGRRVGVIALANVTYAPMRLLTQRMIEIIVQHGLAPLSIHPVSSDLHRAADRLVELINSGSHDAPKDLLADNVIDDEPLEQRQTSWRAHGEVAIAEIVADSDQRADLQLRGADGTVFTVFLELSPLAEARIQYATISDAPA